MYSRRFYDELSALVNLVASSSIYSTGKLKVVDSIMPDLLKNLLSKDMSMFRAIYSETGIRGLTDDPKLLLDEVIRIISINNVRNGYELMAMQQELRMRGTGLVSSAGDGLSDVNLKFFLDKLIENYNKPQFRSGLLSKMYAAANGFDSTTDRLEPIKEDFLRALGNYDPLNVTQPLTSGSPTVAVTAQAAKRIDVTLPGIEHLLCGCYCNLGVANSGKQLISNLFLKLGLYNDTPIYHISAGERADVLLRDQIDYGLLPDLDISLIREDVFSDSVGRFFFSLLTAKEPIIIINSINSIMQQIITNSGLSKAGIKRNLIDAFFQSLQRVGEMTNKVIIATYRTDINEISAGIDDMILGNIWGLFINEALLQKKDKIKPFPYSYTGSMFETDTKEINDGTIPIDKFLFINKQAEKDKVKSIELPVSSILESIGELVHQ